MKQLKKNHCENTKVEMLICPVRNQTYNTTHFVTETDVIFVNFILDERKTTQLSLPEFAYFRHQINMPKIFQYAPD